MAAEGISVSELNMMISEGIRRDPRLRNVVVTAEVGGFKHHLASGHWYFSLKDPASVINCVMFRQNNIRSKVKPADGDRVTVSGYIEFFSRDGKIQLYVMTLRPAGAGSIYENLEALKRKLSLEGLFDPQRKKVLPLFPQKVAVITSASGAALQDILNVSKLRCPGIPILVIPCLVQGEGAAEEIARAVRQASEAPGVDVVILARGGGSAEDLWCFNEEIVVRAIADCRIPLVTGVGHETDTMLCDYAADVRASTPSNAAETVFPDRRDLQSRIAFYCASLLKTVLGRIHSVQLDLSFLSMRLQKLSPEGNMQRLHGITQQLRSRLESVLVRNLQIQDSLLDKQRDALYRSIQLELSRKQGMVQNLTSRLDAVSPLSVLQRGYALVYGTDGSILPDSEHALINEKMKIRFRDGTVDVRREGVD